MKFVSSFAFSPDLEYVVLVQKKRGPAFLIGKWTGIGGGVEKGERASTAARRELREEAGIKIDGKLYCLGRFYRGTECTMFAGCLNEDEDYAKLTDEEISMWPVKDVLSGEWADEMADDTRVLIAMALYALDGGKLTFEARE